MTSRTPAPLVLAVLLAAPAAFAADAPTREVRFRSPDGFKLTATYLPAAKGKTTVILLHGLGAGRHEWDRFIAVLADNGLGALALDFRGHGESDPPPFTTFRSPEAWGKLRKDVDGAVDFLEDEGVPVSRMSIVGASIGANLALKAAAGNRRIAAVALLSPGKDYQGVTLEPEIGSFKRPLLLAASRTDPYSFDTVQELKGKLGGKSRPLRFLDAGSGHGVEMLDSGLAEELVSWLHRPDQPRKARASFR